MRLPKEPPEILGPPSPAIRWSVASARAENTDQGIGRAETRNDGPRTSLRAVVLTAFWTQERLGSLPEFFSSGEVRPRAVEILRLWRWSVICDRAERVVETRRLELLTLSLQRRCSAN